MRPGRLKIALRAGLVAVACLAFPIEAALDYMLKPRQVAKDTYVLVGLTEDFARSNGGNVVNTGFVVTADGVVVIDSGPSRLYGEQLRKAIAHITDRPIRLVLITHHHPDHFLANQAFADVPIAALGPSIAGMKRDGNAFADNLYRMVGDWMRDTESMPATREAQPGPLSIGDHQFELIALKGHTESDLAVLDRSTGVLFCGDLVFWQRAATTPHAKIDEWLASLQALRKLQWKVMVPGHGQPLTDAQGIEQTGRYLSWLDSRLREAAASGVDMPELMREKIPAEFAGIPLIRSEFERSVAHLYSGFEQRALAQPSR